MAYSILDSEEALTKVDRLCLHLFERWCEDKKIVPLAYLLHCWPLTRSDSVSLKRLADAMLDLGHFHAGLLDTEDSVVLNALIFSLLAIVGDWPARRGASVLRSV